MTDYHIKTFYGQKSSIILESPSKSVAHIFISIINRKEDGTWERKAEGEGKTVKISMEEIICILEVLKKKSANWRMKFTILAVIGSKRGLSPCDLSLLIASLMAARS